MPSIRMNNEYDLCLQSSSTIFLSYLPLEPDLMRCASVSKESRPVAERYLFCSIHLVLRRSKADPRNGIDIMLRTLRENPRLIPLVRKLQLEALDYLWFGLPIKSRG